MPSILTEYENVEFIASKNFTYNGVEYRLGDPVPDAKSWGNLESMIRARRVIPVVDDYSKDAPFQFRRTVLSRELAYRKLGIDGPQERTEQRAHEPAVEETSESVEVDEGEYNPADHNIDEVLDYVDENPDELLSVYELEEQGKNRSRLKKKLDDRLNRQVEEEDEENFDV